MTDTTILVVEDDPDGREVIGTILAHHKIQFALAPDAEQAEHQLFQTEAGPYTAIVIDLALPGKDGWELLQTIRNNPDTRDLPCIAITAYHTSKTRQEALSAGFTGYFSKPLNAKAFAQELVRLYFGEPPSQN